MTTKQKKWPSPAEYAAIHNAPRSVHTVIESATVAISPHRTRTYNLTHRTEGYSPAGSMARWDNEAWGVLFEADGAINGRWFKTEAEAQELFDTWTSDD